MQLAATFGCMALAAAAAHGGQSSLHRDGAFWVEEQSGSAAVAPHGEIHIRTTGRVSIKGVEGNGLSFKVRERVRVRSEMDARRILRAYIVKAVQERGLTYLSVQGGPEMADLELTAPKSARKVVIETHAGSVDASQFEGSLRIMTGAGAVSLDQIGGPIVARTAGGQISLGTVAGSVHCVSGGGIIRANAIGGEAMLETAGGDITVERVEGPIRCSTAAGGIRIGEAGDFVVADTAGGPIDVGHARGMVTAKNLSGGPIQVRSASGAACQSAGGAITLTSAGGSLKAETAVGNIIARFQNQPAEDSFLSTTAGDITVWIPSNLKVRIRAENASMGGMRRIVSDFSAIPVKLAGSSAVAEGALNGGGPLVRIAAVGGVIYIRREEK